MITRAEAAAARAAGVRALSDRPSQRRRSEHASGHGVRARFTTRDLAVTDRGVQVPGYGSITEEPYNMYDMFGPYTEIVTAGAFGKTLGASPTVEFTVNHGAGGGMPMARTSNNTLELVEDDTGLRYIAYVDITRSDVANAVKAIERGDLVEASFKFRIESGMWSPDYEEFRINVVDLDGGDVSAVNFGANPAAYTGRDRQPTPDVPDTSRVRVLLDLALAD